MSLLLPLGAESDSFRVYLTVKIIDNNYGQTSYDLLQTVTVYPNIAKTSELMLDIMDNYLNSSLAKTLQETGIKAFSQNMISYASMLNYENSLKSSSTSVANTTAGSLVQVADEATNSRSKVRDSMLKLVDTLKASHMGSVKLISTMMAMITYSLDELSIDSAVTAAQCLT